MLHHVVTKMPDKTPCTCGRNGYTRGVCITRSFAALALVLLQTSCGSHLYNVASENSEPVIRRPLASPVSQSAGTRNARILLHSGISSFRSDDRPPAALVDLGGESVPDHELKRAVYSAGFLPASVPATRTFRILEKTPEHGIATDYQVAYVRRVSIWERFKFFHSDEQTLARALAWSYASGRTVGTHQSAGKGSH